MKKISVIVPVYNIEKYLNDCIDSLINQTYKNIEILLIDDGSKDNSGNICDEYAQKDSRIKVIHQENGGLSKARNTGLDNASGEYIMFCDSDDLFTPIACEVLLNEIESKNADYVIANYQNCDEDGTLWHNPVFDKEKFKNFRLSIKDYIHSFYIMNSGVWNKIFRKSFIDKLNLRFIEKLPAEDAMFTTYCFIKAKSVYYINDIVYLYRQREGDSISTNANVKYFDGINKAYRHIYLNFKENKEINFYRFFYAKSMMYMLYKFIDSNLTYEDKLNILEDMSWFYKLSVKLKVPMCQKAAGFIVNKINEGDYEKAIEMCEIIADIRKPLTREMKEYMSKPKADMYDILLESEIIYE